MAKDVQIRITATDQASPVLRQVGANAAASANQIAQSNQTAGRSYEDLQKRAMAVGASVGTLIGGMALAGQAAASNAREVDALKRVYKDSADEILRFSKELQDNSNFSDEQARQAALTASTLQKSYGLTTDAVETLIERSGDLAQVYGLDLNDATGRIAAAIRGEAEAAELLGLTLNDTYVASQAAARGLTGWTTTMTDAEKAAFRYQLMLEQTNDVQGAAADASEGARGAMYDLIGTLQDGTVAFGQFLGPAGEALSVLGQFAIGAPVAGAALGKLWAGIGALGGLGALGAYGAPLAVAAGGGYMLYDVLANADQAGNNSSDSLYGSAFAGAAGLAKWATPGGFGDSLFGDIQSQFQGIIDENGVEQILSQMFWGVDTEAQAKERFEQLVKSGIFPSMDMGQLQNYATNKGITVPEMFGQAAQQAGMVYDPITKQYFTSEQWIQRQTSLAGPYTGVSGRESYGSSLYNDRANMPAAPWFPNRAANPQADYLGYQAEIQAMQGQIDAALIEYLNSGVIEARDLLRDAYPDSPLSNRPLGGASASGVGNMRPFDRQAESAGAARSAFQTGYNVTIGQTQAMGSDSQGLADFTKDLVNEEGVLGKWDDLVSRGVIDLATQQWASYAEVQGEANQIFATNAEIQDDIAVIQLRQLGYNADLQASYAETIDAISKMDEAEQRRTLAMMDSGEQAKVNEAATIAYRVATGELSEAIGTDLIKGMAMADPLFADLAEQYGLIEVGADGEITVNFPDKENLIDAVGELSDNVQGLIDLLANSLDINITYNDNGALQEVLDLQYALNAAAGTYVATFVLHQIGGNAPSGPQFPGGMDGMTAYSDGGTVHAPLMPAFANGGTWAMVGERGPEVVYLSRGDQVFNTEASRSMTNRSPGRQGTNFNNYGVVNVQAESPDISDAIRQQLMIGVRG